MALTRPQEYQIITNVMGVSDPITSLNQNQTGPSTTDIGLVMNRGTSGNVGFIWNEQQQVFRFIHTPDNGKEQTANVTISSNAPLLSGEQYVSTGNFSLEGDARSGTYMQRNTTTGTATTQLYSDGSAQHLVVSPNSIWTYEILVSAKRIDAGTDGASFKLVGSVGRNTTLDSVFLIGNLSTTVIGKTDSAWDASVSVDTVTGALKITVQGSLGKTVRWVARITTLEVSFTA